jgi:hypothetical protein
MICKHCGYDVPDGIDFCTACGEPLPKKKDGDEGEIEEREDAKVIEKSGKRISQKEFSKGYVPYSVKLSIHVGAIISYLFTAVYLFFGIYEMVIHTSNSSTIIFLIAFSLNIILTLGFEIKKSLACAIIMTALAALFSIYCLVVLHEMTGIWLCAGVLAIFGLSRYQKLWQNYQKTGVLPPHID